MVSSQQLLPFQPGKPAKRRSMQNHFLPNKSIDFTLYLILFFISDSFCLSIFALLCMMMGMDQWGFHLQKRMKEKEIPFPFNVTEATHTHKLQRQISMPPNNFHVALLTCQRFVAIRQSPSSDISWQGTSCYMHTVDQNVTKGKEDKATRQARSAMQRSQTGLCISKRLDGPSTCFPPSRHPPLCMASAELLMPLLTGGPCGPPHC